MSSIEELTSLIGKTGEAIRDAKASGKSKEEIMPLVTELLNLKEKFKIANNGVPFDPPKSKDDKKKSWGPALLTQKAYACVRRSSSLLVVRPC